MLGLMESHNLQLQTIMKFQLSSIIMCLCAAIQVTSADNDFKKYLSAKKPSFDLFPSSIVGMYQNWLINYWEGDINFIDVDTGALVKTIIGLIFLTSLLCSLIHFD
jgi:hypothetical protein